MLPVLRRNRLNPLDWDGFDVNREFDRLLGTAFGAPSLSAWSPAVDVRETNDEFIVTAELPGMTRDDVELTIENGVLSLSGEKREEREEGAEGTGRHIYERRYGRFQRNFSLPRGVDADHVDAKFKDGVLMITLPKVAAAKPRQIKIGS